MAQLPKKNSSGSSNPQASGANKSSGSSSAGGRPPVKPGSTSGSSGGSSKTGKASKPVSSQSQYRGSRPPAARQPVGKGGKPAPQQSDFRSSIDRTLPPFSTRRYLAIWIPIMAVVLIVLLVLLFTLNNNPSSTSTAQATPTVPLGGAVGGATAAPQPATGGQNTTPPPAVPPVVVVTATQSLTGTGTYMTIDTAKGKIITKLYTDPSAGVTKTVANFVSKANAGYFNGLTFHRVEDWVIQGGDPLGNGTGGGTMPAEYNNIPFDVGALGVARGGDPALNNDSQFFIVKDASAAAGLVGMYTNFGQVVQGMDVVTKIAIGDKINSITIENK